MRIDGGNEQSNNQVIEKYCYLNDETYCDEYGGLYQWDELMQYMTSEGVKGICPEGWHIPSYSEGEALLDFCGGEDFAGGKLRETGTNHWEPPTEGSTNETGFTALGAGIYDQGYHVLKRVTHFWSSTESDSLDAWYLFIQLGEDGVKIRTEYKLYGQSVRCIKDE